MSKAIAGQVILITGASSGIGAEAARWLARAGCRLVLLARRADRLEQLAQELAPAEVAWVAGDMTVAADRERFVAVAQARFERIDGLINNAGFGQRGPLEMVPVDAMRRNFEVNVFSLIALTQLVVPIMRAQGGGRILNVGSVAGKIARPMSAVYDATKHALEAFSDGLRGELRPWNIDVVVIRPGFIITEFVDAANAVSADVIADAGPYAGFLKGFSTAHLKLRRIAGEPEDIARVIRKALQAKRPATHYNAPGHAKVFLLLKALLPTRVFDRIVGLRRSG